MAKKMLIDATHSEETRVVVVDGNRIDEFDFESENKRQLAGNIYLAKVTRVEPSLQAAFVDYGGNRHGFLAFSEIHPDYYQIPVADREALLAEERTYAKAQAAEEEKSENEAVKSRSTRRSKSKTAPARVDSKDRVTSEDADIPGMTVVELDEAEAPDAQGDSEQPQEIADAPGDTGSDEISTTAASSRDDTQAPAADISDDAANGDEPEKGESARDATLDAEIEAVADDDVAEELPQRHRQRARKYKIQEVVKVRQILLVQVVKEERGNKGAALTTYLSLAGRYCVLMPNTARGGGISRKISNATDRKKLKEIANTIEVPEGAGLIIRTAGAQRTKTEIKRDYEYLQRLWEQIRDLTLKSIAPAKIYEEGDLIRRSIRDLYNKDIDEVFVEGEAGYRVAKEFMKMIMPSHAKNVKQYSDPMPLFARHQVESYLSSMFNPTVQLKSGGYIVIGVTEALVAIDVNSGRATKEGSIEETALKTNLEAAEEVARQLRLRDLAGLIVIDFIDMDERRNNAAVEKRFKDRLKSDRARIQVGRISGFGLMELSRQRLRPGMLEATTQPCNHCHGTGLIRSDDNLALSILRQLEEEGVRRKSREVLIKAPVGIVNFLVNQKREHIARIETQFGLSVRVEADPFLISPDFAIEKFKTATRVVAEPDKPVVSVDPSLMSEFAEDGEPEAEATDDAEAAPAKKKRRRRRRRKGGGTSAEAAGAQDETPTADQDVAAAEPPAGAPEPAAVEDVTAEAPEKLVKKTVTRKSRSTSTKAKAPEDAADAVGQEPEEPGPAAKKITKRASNTKAKKDAEEADATAEQAETPAKPRRAPPRKPKAAGADAEMPQEETKAPVPAAEPALATTTAAEDDKPKRTGWWSLVR